MECSLHDLFNRITDIPPDDWSRFEERLQFKEYSANDLFLKEGQVSGSIGIVTKGLFRMYSVTEKKEINYNFFSEGQFVVDYESYLKGRPSSFMIQALEDSELYVFSKEHILQQFRESHAWERFGRLITEQVFLKSRGRIKEMLFMDAEQRYLKFIEQYKGLYERLPLYHIASYLGIDATSLSRIRKILAQKIIS